MTDPAPAIVYLKQAPLRPYEIDRLGIGFFRDRGFAVTVLDVASICFPQIDHRAEREANYPGFTGLDLRTLLTQDDLRRERQTLAGAEFIVALVGSGGINTDNLPIFRALRRAGRRGSSSPPMPTRR